MSAADLLSRLQSPRTENARNTALRRNAISLLQLENTKANKTDKLLFDLLIDIIKPLFATKQHAALTATGRKKLVAPPPSEGRFTNSIFDDDLKPWKNDWTIDVLMFILSQYSLLEESSRKPAIESHFHLLVPPILNTLDDSDIRYKTEGCRLLRLLCQELTACHSDILKRTGLAEVFVDALKTNFMLLPTLTAEDESLALLNELYPAFRCLVAARFHPVLLRPSTSAVQETTLTIRHTKVPSTAPRSFPTKYSELRPTQTSSSAASSTDRTARQSLLDTLLRDGVLASYAHASDYTDIAIFLISEAGLIVSDMGIYSAKHLYQLLPLLRHVLSNPFGAASPSLLLASLQTMKTLILVCWPRIKEVWWGDCLRSCVACWMTISEDLTNVQEEMGPVKQKLQELVSLLAELVGEEIQDVQARLVKEEKDLENLFNMTPTQ